MIRFRLVQIERNFSINHQALSAGDLNPNIEDVASQRLPQFLAYCRYCLNITSRTTKYVKKYNHTWRNKMSKTDGLFKLKSHVLLKLNADLFRTRVQKNLITIQNLRNKHFLESKPWYTLHSILEAHIHVTVSLELTFVCPVSIVRRPHPRRERTRMLK